MSCGGGAMTGLGGEDAAGAALPADAVDAIGTTLDEHTTCEELAAYALRRGAEAAAVDLPAPDAPAAEPGRDTPLSRIAAVGRTDLLPAPSAPPAPAREAPAEGAAVTGAAGSPDRARHRIVSAPLPDRGGGHGRLVAVRREPGFSGADIASLYAAARLAAVHLGHARRHRALRETVLDLQRALLAEPGRPHPNLDLAVRHLPAGGGTLVGGDWFETVRLHYGRTLLVVGDVMGHGLDAAVDMNAYRSMLRYVASTDLPPHRVLRRLDAAVAEEGTRRPATCLLVRVDPARGTAAIAGAGHLPPVVFAGDGSGELLSLPVGPPLGTGVGGYEQVTRALGPEDTLVMYTDGLVERRGEDIDVSLARLASLRLPLGTGVGALLDEVLHRLDARHAEDDVAVVAARIRPRHPSGASG
ncbi:PP2C family protein-serine/threonine phosphatase [Streptomyces sp. NPDC048566]|uniref:PP2C family protein-serine/threonine phosphatase n=1 Tax=Streptomyces sp. NPDC048566 TaxID=3365569 RepID=UPI0037148258